MREIKLLQSLNHPHVISLKELMVSKGAVYMVFEYMDYDLTGILAHPNLKFRPEHIKCLMKQLLEGLGFLHHKGVLHRDIKGKLRTVQCLTFFIHMCISSALLSSLFSCTLT